MTALSYFIPDSTIGILFVVGLLAWFVFWCSRLNKESVALKNVGASFATLEACIPPLRQHQVWRDKEKSEGRVPTLNPSQVLTDILKVQAQASRAPFPVEAVRAQFEAIFLAGCDESSLDLSELSAATMQSLTRTSQSLRLELALYVLAGVLGTLLALVHTAASGPIAQPLGTANALAPAIWSFLLALVGGIFYLRFQTTVQNPVLSTLRRVTTTVWVPKLYPTVAQRAAQWAVRTLKNAADVMKASEVIEKNTVRFTSSITDARQTAELFSEGMKNFARGIQGADQTLVRAQTGLVETVSTFAHSLSRWSAFEDEIRSFYRSVDAHQGQLVQKGEALDGLLISYKDLTRQLTVQADEIRASHLQEMAKFEERLLALTNPIHRLEDRLRDLSTPFERAAHNLQEIATNLWKLNESAVQNLNDHLNAVSSKNNSSENR